MNADDAFDHEQLDEQIRSILTKQYPNAKSIEVDGGEAEVIHLEEASRRVGEYTTPEITSKIFFYYGPDNAETFGFEESYESDPAYLHEMHQATLYDGIEEREEYEEGEIKFWDQFMTGPDDTIYRKPKK